jgi:hypothetical protein
LDQRYLYPAALFPAEAPGEPTAWACVRTRARAEKRLSEWLTSRNRPHYLPTLLRDTISHRRRRQTELPAFPGYLFVAGGAEKADFARAGAAVDFVPVTDSARLHRELWSLWRGLSSGSPLELVRELEPGEWVEVAAGALKGTQGRFQRWGKHGRIVLWVEILGAGAAVEIDETSVIRAV